MKKVLLIGLLVLTIFTSTACEEKSADGLNIATTIYPITYIVNELYPEGNTISIYPEDVEDVQTYVLTEKRIKEYSQNDVFIFNMLSNELKIAIDLNNQNSKIQAINIANDINITGATEELWLSPNHYLYVAGYIKNNLQSLIKSKYVNEEIEKRYQTLNITLSEMDANLREIARDAEATNHNTIVTSSNIFKYLKNYGFNVISLEDEENLTNNNLTSIKNNFKNNTYTTIFMKKNEEKNDLIKSFENECNAKIVTVNTMETLTPDEKENNQNYLTIMEEYIENIRKVTLGE